MRRVPGPRAPRPASSPGTRGTTRSPLPRPWFCLAPPATRRCAIGRRRTVRELGHGRRAASSASRCAARCAACDATTRCWIDSERCEKWDAGAAPSSASALNINSPAGGIVCAARPGRRASACRCSTCTCRTPRRGSPRRRYTAASSGAPATRRRVFWTTAIGASVRARAVRRLPRPRSRRRSRRRRRPQRLRFVRNVQATKGSLGGLEISARLELRVKIDGVDDCFRGHTEGVRRLY